MNILKHLTTVISCCLIISCNSLKPIEMSESSWKISDSYGRAVNNDATYCISFGDDLIPKNLRMIGNADTLASNPQMYKYVQDLLHLSRLDEAKVLFFAPQIDEMFVEIPNGYKYPKPNSVSSNMMENQPWTGWIRDDDFDSWERKPDEMYTYIYIDKKDKLLVIVDCFNYLTQPIARIQRIQTNTKNFRRKFPNGEVNSIWADITKPEHLEAVSNWIDGHRNKSFANYRIGQEQKFRNK